MLFQSLSPHANSSKKTDEKTRGLFLSSRLFPHRSVAKAMKRQRPDPLPSRNTAGREKELCFNVRL